METTPTQVGGASRGGQVERPSLLDRLIPPALRRDAENLPRARVVTGLCMLGVVGDGFFALISTAKMDVPTMLLCLVGAGTQLFALRLLWRTQRVGPPASLLTALWMGSVISAAVAVDADLTLRSGWPLFTVVLATYLLGARGGMVSALGFAVALTVIGRLQALGMLPVGASATWSTGPGQVLGGISLLLICAFLGVLHQRAYDRVVAEVAQVNTHLQRSEAAVRSLLDSSRDLICSVDRDLRIVELNGTSRAALIRRGLQPPFTGLPLFEAALAPFTEELRTRLRHAIDHTLRGELVEFDETFSAQGSSRSYSFTIDPVRLEDGTPVGATVVVRDITDRRGREARSMIADRMTTVGTLAAGMAHELNNPLACIAANLEFTRDVVGGTPSAGDLTEVGVAIDEARESAVRMRDIIRDLKTFSRAEEVEGPVVVEDAVEAAIKMCLNELRHRAQLVRDYQPAGPVKGSATRLQQVVLNLLVNAVHATPEGDAQNHRIAVRIGRHASGAVRVEVEDTGCGIPAENLKRIFDPFFTTKDVGEGTGLGLSICHNLIQSMGGEIQVTSAVGRGSTFRLLLPAAPGERDPASRAPSASSGAITGATILVVDDEPDLLAALRRVLGRVGAVVTTTTRGAEAVERLQRGERFELLLCDVMMPEMDGVELFEQVERLAPDQARRMAFLSGGAFSPRTRSFLERQTRPTLTKPCELQVLVELVRQVRATGTTVPAGKPEVAS